MALAGKNALVRLSSGATAFMNQPSTTADDTVYQVASTTIQGRPFDRTAAIVARNSSAGGGSTFSGYAVNRLNGSIIFSSSAARTVFLTGSYLPLVTVAEAHEFTGTLVATNLEDNAFGDDFITRQQGVKDGSGTLSEWHTTTEGRRFTGLLTSTSDMPVVIELQGGSTGVGFDLRMWSLLSGVDVAATVDALADDTVNWDGSADQDGRLVTFSTAGEG